MEARFPKRRKAAFCRSISAATLRIEDNYIANRATSVLPIVSCARVRDLLPTELRNQRSRDVGRGPEDRVGAVGRGRGPTLVRERRWKTRGDVDVVALER